MHPWRHAARETFFEATPAACRVSPVGERDEHESLFANQAELTSSMETGAEHTLIIRTPDDFHLHLRDGPMLEAVAPISAAQFGRALIMPNLNPPVRTVRDALAYRERIMAAIHGGQSEVPHAPSFEPLMALYLTDGTTPEMVREAAASKVVKAYKLYPAGATTNSAAGVTSLEGLYPALNAMADCGIVLCIHGESTAKDVDPFDREAHFVQQTLPGLMAAAPKLRVVLEHCTTKQAVEFVSNFPEDRIAGTLTCHHLMYTRAALFEGSRLRPHMYCLPVLKAEEHRSALLHAIKHNEKGRFFLGTDSAPHLEKDKSTPKEGCAAGVFSAPCAMELYAEIFDSVNALEKLEAFCSLNGAAFYGLEPNKGSMKLAKRARSVADSVPVHPLGSAIVPIRAGHEVAWTCSRIEK
ncbi:Dihydroorotase [Porphyridium purpureum]|uniref:dihydroorotase n=1 Tax=Porphyridium purpureum TaxID=35688 RepID=A0A5J4YX56_PORPP|nr:Dihydroorotase [Porphyridium purpureum]|eukprot:POR9138..scf209_3